MMPKVSFGKHYRACARDSDREQIRSFYTEVLTCEMHASDGVTSGIPDNIDLFIFSSGECFGVEYYPEDSPILSLDAQKYACWTEIETDDVAALKERCLANGATEITDYWDKGHFYFHAPGGQVFRIIGKDE